MRNLFLTIMLCVGALASAQTFDFNCAIDSALSLSHFESNDTFTYDDTEYSVSYGGEVEGTHSYFLTDTQLAGLIVFLGSEFHYGIIYPEGRAYSDEGEFLMALSEVESTVSTTATATLSGHIANSGGNLAVDVTNQAELSFTDFPGTEIRNGIWNFNFNNQDTFIEVIHETIVASTVELTDYEVDFFQRPGVSVEQGGTLKSIRDLAVGVYTRPGSIRTSQDPALQGATYTLTDGRVIVLGQYGNIISIN